MMTMVSDHRATLDRVALALLERETLEGDDLQALLREPLIRVLPVSNESEAHRSVREESYKRRSASEPQ